MTKSWEDCFKEWRDIKRWQKVYEGDSIVFEFMRACENNNIPPYNLAGVEKNDEGGIESHTMFWYLGNHYVYLVRFLPDNTMESMMLFQEKSELEYPACTYVPNLCEIDRAVEYLKIMNFDNGRKPQGATA
jgi:hypothetical protein